MDFLTRPPEDDGDSGPSAVAIDFGALLRRCAGDAEFARLMLARGGTSVEREIGRIGRAVAAADRDALRASAHTLKGTAGNMSAVRLASLALALEDAPPGAPFLETEALAAELGGEWSRCRAEIDRFAGTACPAAPHEAPP